MQINITITEETFDKIQLVKEFYGEMWNRSAYFRRLILEDGLEMYDIDGNLTLDYGATQNAYDRILKQHYKVIYETFVDFELPKGTFKKSGFYFIPDTQDNVTRYVNDKRREK
jgi:hypothetical protein